MNLDNNLNTDWKKILNSELNSENFSEIEKFLEQEEKIWKKIFPPKEKIFNAFNLTKFEDVKVVILWQDPYHWEWQAHWLCFSVQNWTKNPPSLKNIFKELNSDLWIIVSEKDDLNSWDLTKLANQWVFLLNAIMTVEEWQPASHSKIWYKKWIKKTSWWENFTDSVIEKIASERSWVVFLLWWNFAKWKKKFIEKYLEKNNHYVLESAHPSPFSVKNFSWCRHFSKVNEILKKKWECEIDWDFNN